MNNTEWNNTTKHIVGVGLTLFGLYLLYLSRSVLTLLVIAALIAFLLMPLVNLFRERLRLPRGIAVLLTYLTATLLILLSPLVFVPPIINGFNALSEVNYQVLVDDGVQWVEATLQNLKAVDLQPLGLNVNLDEFIDPALTYLETADSDITPTLPSFSALADSLRSALTVTYGIATNVAGTVFSGAFIFIVTLLSAVYMSLDGHKFSKIFLGVMPADYRPEVSVLLARLKRIWRAYFRGQLNLMLMIGVITWLGNTALGLPGAFALGVIAGFMELIPNLGPFLAAVPAVLVALLQGSTYLGVDNLVFALIVVGFYLLVQQIENTLIVPKILGGAVDLHPLVVMIGVVVGANVGGILGALLAAPTIASGREIIRYLYTKILGQEPFPPDLKAGDEAEISWLEQGKQFIHQVQQQFAPLARLFTANSTAKTPPPEESAPDQEETAAKTPE